MSTEPNIMTEKNMIISKELEELLRQRESHRHLIHKPHYHNLHHHNYQGLLASATSPAPPPVSSSSHSGGLGAAAIALKASMVAHPVGWIIGGICALVAIAAILDD